MIETNTQLKITISCKDYIQIACKLDFLKVRFVKRHFYENNTIQEHIETLFSTSTMLGDCDHLRYSEN